MPAINAPTLAEHRALRRDALVEAAATVMRERGSVSMASVAEHVGLSRSAVYEYYRSAADLIADVLVDELAAWRDHLDDAVSREQTTAAQVHAWIDAVLAYVVDGRHALVRAAGRTALPAVRRAQVQAMHRDLLTPLVTAFGDAPTAHRQAVLVWGVVESAITAIENGADGQQQADLAWAFCQAGLSL